MCVFVCVCVFVPACFLVLLPDYIYTVHTVPVKKKLKYQTVGAVAVRYLYARGTLEVRSRYAGSTLKVRSRYARSTLEGTLEQDSVPSKCALESRP